MIRTYDFFVEMKTHTVNCSLIDKIELYSNRHSTLLMSKTVEIKNLPSRRFAGTIRFGISEIKMLKISSHEFSVQFLLPRGRSDVRSQFQKQRPLITTYIET